MLDIYEALHIMYKVLDKLSILLVWMMMFAGCILLWYFVFVFIFSS